MGDAGGVGVASFVIQCHIGFALAAVTLLAWGAAGRVLVRRDRRVSGNPADPAAGRARRRRSWILTGVVLLALWGPPGVQQLRGHPGNLTTLAKYLTGHGPADVAGDPGVGVARAGGLVARQLGVPAPWMGGRTSAGDVGSVQSQSQALVSLVPTVAVLLAASAAAAVRRRRDLLYLLAGVLPWDSRRWRQSAGQRSGQEPGRELSSSASASADTTPVGHGRRP